MKNNNTQKARGSNIDQSVNKNEISALQNIDKALSVTGPISIINNSLNINDILSLVDLYVVSKKDDLTELVKECIDEVLLENRKTPDFRIFVPIIQKLSYSLDDSYIKILYKNLLKSSIKCDTSNIVHPSFSTIIEQLNSDEAKLLQVIFFSATQGPLITVNKKIPNNKGSIPILNKHTIIGKNVCEFPANVVKYMENLERLKLIEIDMDAFFTEEQHYHPLYLSLPDYFNSDFSIKTGFELKKGLYSMTSFGKDFCNVCMR